jgi:predicted house-cleaning noncanonical NTP pyrophosphatase (MazG superfamily)
MQELGQKVTYHKLTDDELLSELHRKLLEEAKEFDPNKPQAVSELADIMEVVESLALQLGSSVDDLKMIQQDRRTNRGGFEAKIYVERLDLEDNDPWVEYYAQEPDRFPEVNS